MLISLPLFVFMPILGDFDNAYEDRKKSGCYEILRLLLSVLCVKCNGYLTFRKYSTIFYRQIFKKVYNTFMENNSIYRSVKERGLDEINYQRQL